MMGHLTLLRPENLPVLMGKFRGKPMETLNLKHQILRSEGKLYQFSGKQFMDGSWLPGARKWRVKRPNYKGSWFVVGTLGVCVTRPGIARAGYHQKRTGVFHQICSNMIYCLVDSAHGKAEKKNDSNLDKHAWKIQHEATKEMMDRHPRKGAPK